MTSKNPLDSVEFVLDKKYLVNRRHNIDHKKLGDKWKDVKDPENDVVVLADSTIFENDTLSDTNCVPSSPSALAGLPSIKEVMLPKDISNEAWREYDFGGRVYRINLPVSLYIGTTTHRVVTEDNIIHCVPAPGFQGCVLRWTGKDGTDGVKF